MKYWRHLWNSLAENRGHFFLTLFVAVVFSGVSVLTPTVSGKMLTAFTKTPSAGNRYLLLYGLLGLGQVVCCLVDDGMRKRLQRRQKQLMRRQAFAAFSQKASAGQEAISSFTSYLNNDIPTLTEQFYIGTIDIIQCVFLLVFSAVSLLSVHWILALIVLTISGAIVLFPNIMRKTGGDARAAYSGALGAYNTTLYSFLNGLPIVKSYGYYDRANRMQEVANAQVAEKERVLNICQWNVLAVNSVLQIGKTLLILIVGIVLISCEQMEIGGLVTVVQLAEMIAAPAEVLAYMIHARNESLPLLERYETLLSEQEATVRTLPFSEPLSTISVSHVSYQCNHLPILRDITTTFEAGKKYLIVGESGSGKSTLLRLIAGGGREHYSGEILCNGREIHTLSQTDYSHHVCPVFQEPYLFHATLEENILLGRDISKDIYADVIAKLNLQYLLERYQGQEITPEILEQLSGGERQRVALARAIVGQPEVYLLDEVTSALDSRNSETIETLLLNEDAMVIHVCHKTTPSLRSMYDSRLVMREGQLSVG